MNAWLSNPAVLSALAYLVYAIASSAVRALPAPREGGPAFYAWFYTFAHLLGANWDRVKVALAVLFKAYVR
jgi:hypothetical protein